MTIKRHGQTLLRCSSGALRTNCCRPARWCVPSMTSLGFDFGGCLSGDCLYYLAPGGCSNPQGIDDTNWCCSTGTVTRANAVICPRDPGDPEYWEKKGSIYYDRHSVASEIPSPPLGCQNCHWVEYSYTGVTVGFALWLDWENEQVMSEVYACSYSNFCKRMRLIKRTVINPQFYCGHWTLCTTENDMPDPDYFENPCEAMGEIETGISWPDLAFGDDCGSEELPSCDLDDECLQRGPFTWGKFY